MHRRLRPAAASVSLPRVLAADRPRRMPTLPARLKLFSHNRFNLFGLHEADHGDGSATPLRIQAERLLVGGRDRDRGRRDPPALHAANARLRLQSDQRLLLPSARTGNSPRSSTRSTTRSANAIATSPRSRRRTRRDPAKLPQGLLRLSLHGYGPALPFPARRARGAVAVGITASKGGEPVLNACLAGRRRRTDRSALLRPSSQFR